MLNGLSNQQAAEQFWSWSCQTYQFSAVRKLCLLLQDEYQLNVNFLLLAIWTEQQAIGLIAEDWQTISAECEPIELKIQQMRAKRRRLKSVSHQQYTKALELELKGEKFLQNQAIKSISALQNNKQIQHEAAKEIKIEALSHNLQAYLKQQQVTDKAKISALQLQELVHRLVD